MADRDFDKLLKSIQDINVELEKLSKKIIQTDAEFSRLSNPKDIDRKGDRLYRLEAALAEKEKQLRALQASAVKNTSDTRVSLGAGVVDERRMNLAALGVPMTTAEIISKAREISRRILAERRNDLAQESIQANNSRAAQGLRDISLQRDAVLARDRGAPLGRIPGEINFADIEADALKNYKPPAKSLDTEAIKKFGREAAERILNQIQNELLQGAIEAAARKKYDAANKNYLRGVQSIGQDEARTGAIRPGESLISHPTTQFSGAATPSIDFPNLRGQQGIRRQQEYMRQLQEQLESYGGNQYAGELRGGLDESIAKEKKEHLKNAQERTKREREALAKMTAEQRSDYFYTKFKSREGPADESRSERMERERQQVLQENIAAHKKYTNALKVATEKGFGIEDLKNVYNRGTDIDRLQFSKRDSYGVKQNLDLYTNNAGKVTPGISNQFRSFGQGVVRDIGELTKWSIALAAVYGPLNKLKELTQEMIVNQSKLAEAVVSVNSSFLDQSKIFDIAADAANASGEAVGGVIDAFTQAFRATGGGSDQVERLATAQQLLSDSLILSKLSTLDQAQAIDTLSAALRQSGQGLNEGTELLDSWVRVTKVANVDLTTLATGFAVLGDAAESAGISADELNGIIAAIAETGISSGKETANIARSIVSGFQSDAARRELEALGIAVEDTTGTMRPFLDVMGEIYNLRQNKIIDDTQFSRLTLALGGGTRRQAAYSSFIENFDRVFAVAEESEKASGDAQAALAKQLETVQTALDRLGNAFSSLAQTMGTEGGFLGIITESVDIMTGLVNIFETLVGVLGKATPALAAFIAASLLLKTRGSGSIQDFLGDLGGGEGIQAPTLDDRLEAAGQGRSSAEGKRTLASNFLGTGPIAAITQGIGVALIPALQNFANKDDKFGDAKGTADIAGGVFGGVLGSLTGVGPVIGATIGTAIAEVFVSKTIDYITDPTAYSKKAGLGESFSPSLDEGQDKALEDAVAGLYKSIGGGSEAAGKLLTGGMQKTAESLIDQLNESIRTQDEAGLEKVFGGRYGEQQTELLGRLGITPEFASKAFEENKPIEASAENLTYQLADEASKKIYDAVLSAITATQETGTDAATPFGSLVAQNKEQYSDLLNSLKESSRKDVSSQRLAGDLKGTEYARRTSAIEGFDTKALNYYTALGEEFINVNKGVDDATEAFAAFNQIIVSGSADTIPEITSIVAEVQNLINLLGDPVLNEDALKAFGGAQGAREKLESLQNTGANLLNDVYNQSTLSSLKVPGIQGDINKPLSENDFGEMITKYNELEKQFYQDYLGFTQEQVDIVTAGFEEWAQVVGESGDVFFKKVSETDPALWQQAMSELMEEGKLESQKTTPFGIQQLDLTSQEGAGLQGQIDYFSKYLAQEFSQYQQNPEEFGVIFSDYVTDVLHGDNLAVQLALQGLNDKAQKQLDGQYNIPEGATFWVPLSAAYYRPKNEGGSNGMGTIDTKPLDNSANNLDQAAMNLSQAADLFKESQMRGAQIAEGLPGASAGGREANRSALRFPGKYSDDAYRTDGSAGGSDKGTSFVDTLKNGLLSFFRAMESVPGMDRFGTQEGKIGGRIPETSVNTASTARLDIRFESTTQLMVDGRVLATIIKPHLASDLLKLEGSQGTVTKRYVI